MSVQGLQGQPEAPGSAAIFTDGHIVDFPRLDLDQMSAAAAHWRMEQVQWGKGRLEASLKGIHTASLQLGLSGRSTGFFAHGDVPRDSIMLAVLLRADHDFRYRGLLAQPADIFTLRHGEEFEISTRRDSGIVTVAIDETLLERCFRSILGEPLGHWRQHELLRMAQPRIAAFLPRFLAQCLEMGIGAIQGGDSAKLAWLERSVITALVRSTGRPDIQASRAGRWHQAKFAEEYLRAHVDQPISLPDLCEAVGVNERTLFLGFRERYGLSPKAYLKRLRLNHARRELLNATPETTVTSVATQWCFFQLGQFSAEYRSLFGERPRDTLRNALGGRPAAAIERVNAPEARSKSRTRE
jgi:AraC family ethanolamine operon transcriptional activator